MYNKKFFLIVLTFVCICHFTSAQRSLGTNFSVGNTWWKMNAINHNFFEVESNSYHPSLFRTYQLDVYYQFNDEMSIKIGYTSFFETTDERASQQILEQPKILNQILVAFSINKALFKGIHIGLEGGLVFNSLTNDFKTGTVFYSYSDSTYKNTNTVISKSNLSVFPSLGFQIEYRFKNGLKLYFLTSRMFAFDQNLTQSVVYENINDNLVKTISRNVNFDQLWTRFGIGIPLYNFDRNNELE